MPAPIQLLKDLKQAVQNVEGGGVDNPIPYVGEAKKKENYLVDGTKDLVEAVLENEYVRQTLDVALPSPTAYVNAEINHGFRKLEAALEADIKLKPDERKLDLNRDGGLDVGELLVAARRGKDSVASVAMTALVAGAIGKNVSPELFNQPLRKEEMEVIRKGLNERVIKAAGDDGKLSKEEAVKLIGEMAAELKDAKKVVAPDSNIKADNTIEKSKVPSVG